MNDTAETAGTIIGIIAGLITGALIVNNIIFPIALGKTLIEVLQLL